jgi:hypothetical protein
VGAAKHGDIREASKHATHAFIAMAETVFIAYAGAKAGYSQVSELTSAGKIRAATARMTAAESRFSHIANVELRELLIEIEMEGIKIPGKVVEVGATQVKDWGGALHDIKARTTFVNLGEVKSQLSKLGLQTPKQVLLHEFGHYKQRFKLKTDAQGYPKEWSKFEREAAASKQASRLAKDPGDVAALKAHAAEKTRIAEMLKTPL